MDDIVKPSLTLPKFLGGEDIKRLWLTWILRLNRSMTGGEVLIEEEKQVRPAEINGKRMSAGEV